LKSSKIVPIFFKAFSSDKIFQLLFDFSWYILYHF
jgi:hypothetical protein